MGTSIDLYTLTLLLESDNTFPLLSAPVSVAMLTNDRSVKH